MPYLFSNFTYIKVKNLLISLTDSTQKLYYMKLNALNTSSTQH